MGGYGWITESIVHVDGGGGAFEDTECPDYGRRHSILGLIDFEVLEGPFCLGAPVLVRRDLDLAEGIALCSC